MSIKGKEPIPCPECNTTKYFEGLCYKCTNRQKREAYEALTPSEVEAMVETIITKMMQDQYKEVENDFTNLVAYHDINTEKIAHIAFEKRLFYPPELYKDASAQTQEALIALLLDPACKDANAILCSLATIGSERVREVFYALEKNPLPWRKKLYVDPSIYAECGGWSFDTKGDKIDLIYQDTYALYREKRVDNAIKLGTKRAGTCSVCGCSLVDILTLDGTDERLAFLGIKGKIKIPICPSCASMCEKILVRYQVDGESTFEMIEPFGDENYMSPKDLEDLENNQLVLSLEKKPLYYGRGCDELCTIGGNPVWIQDWQYETCPDCQKKMKLLAALSWDYLFDSMEGTLYVEICTDCSTVVLFHQQT